MDHFGLHWDSHFVILAPQKALLGVHERFGVVGQLRNDKNGCNWVPPVSHGATRGRHRLRIFVAQIFSTKSDRRIQNVIWGPETNYPANCGSWGPEDGGKSLGPTIITK